jgi:hypothetical protein
LIYAPRISSGAHTSKFDKYFDKPTAAGRRKTTLPTKGCPFTRRNLNIPGLKYSTAGKKGKKIVERR